MTLRKYMLVAATAAAICSSAAQATTLQIFPADGSLDVTFSNIVGEQQIRLNVGVDAQFACQGRSHTPGQIPLADRTDCRNTSFSYLTSIVNTETGGDLGPDNYTVIEGRNYSIGGGGGRPFIWTYVNQENPTVHVSVPLGIDVLSIKTTTAQRNPNGNAFFVIDEIPGYSARFKYFLTFDDNLQVSIAEDELLPAPIPPGLPLLLTAILGLTFIGRQRRKAGRITTSFT